MATIRETVAKARPGQFLIFFGLARQDAKSRSWKRGEDPDPQRPRRWGILAPSGDERIEMNFLLKVGYYGASAISALVLAVVAAVVFFWMMFGGTLLFTKVHWQ